jgi:hypothetical protein
MPQPNEALEVEVSEQIGPIAGAATYRSAEYSLVYKATPNTAEANAMRSASGAWRQTGRRIFVTSGFVTLTFDGEPFAFTELDAYANDAGWAERDIALPMSAGRGALVLADERPDDERMSIESEPVFEMDRARKTIRIEFAQQSGTYFEIGAGVLAGILEGRLTSIILSDVRFE